MRNKLDIYSPFDGKIKYALRTKSDYGYRLYIEYDQCIMMFAHLEDFYVKEGQEVKAGEVIGKMGNTGYGSGTHLHVSAFSKRSPKLTAEWAVDPTFYLKLSKVYITNTKVSNPFGSKYRNPKLKIHEGLDFGTELIPGWEKGNIDPLYQDYLLKEKHPEYYE